MVHFQPFPTIFVSEYGSKKNNSAQKISKIFSDLLRARCAPQVLFLYPPPIFQVKVTPLEQITRESSDELSWVGVRIGGRVIHSLRYADDIALIVQSPPVLQLLLDSELPLQGVWTGHQC